MKFYYHIFNLNFLGIPHGINLSEFLLGFTFEKMAKKVTRENLKPNLDTLDTIIINIWVDKIIKLEEKRKQVIFLKG